MKRILKSALTLLLVCSLFLPMVALSNMAAPDSSDIASAVTFEKNNEVAVLSETLDITVQGAEANIVATYQMKNTTDQSVSTQSMFLSPNIKDSGVSVLLGGKPADYHAESYALNYSTEVATDDWRYIVLVDENVASPKDTKTVDTITFQTDFAPGEAYEAVISYRYRLGGYPDHDSNAKFGKIEYYLAPAAMWKDFSGLTINLHLDKDMPVVKSSSLDFKKVGDRSYQYRSDTLPEQNLFIAIDENWWQNIGSTLRSPYLLGSLRLFAPMLIFFALIVLIIVLLVRRARKREGMDE